MVRRWPWNVLYITFSSWDLIFCPVHLQTGGTTIKMKMADHLVTFSRPCWRLPKRGCSVKFTGKVHLGVSVAKPLTILCGRRWKKLCQLESGMREGDNNTQFENRRGVVRLRGGGGARKGGKKEHRRRELFLRYIGIYRIYSRISIVTDFTCLVTILQLYKLLYKAIRYSPLRAQGNDRKWGKMLTCL